MMKSIGLIGYPLKHSISPYFQQAALDYCQLNIRYADWEISPDKLGSAVAKLKEPQNLGANVTVPYKEAVFPLLDEVDHLANLIGAVNTITKKDNRLLGFNTDAYGFMHALRKQGHFEPQGKQVVVLGAGGVARAATFALVEKKISSLIIINRTSERAKALAHSLQSYIRASSLHPQGLDNKVDALPWQSLSFQETFDRCHLIVNCTTIGMKYGSQEGQSPLSLEVIPKDILVYDLVYNPWPTPLLELARKAGANMLGGLAMLVYQGAASFQLWTGREAPLDIMFRKAKEILLGGGK